MNRLELIKTEIRKLANPLKAKELMRFFKTAPGQYGEGDIFLGITVPVLRNLAKKFKDLNLGEIEKLIVSKYHEERFVALILLINRYKRAKQEEKNAIFDFYLNQISHINNWDLVDVSAGPIIGAHIFGNNHTILYQLASSANLWERRISMLASFHFIKNNFFDETLRLAEILLPDKEDLMHKAVGWMIREVGKRDFDQANDFVERHYQKMPRTMLRYAIEKFPEDLRQNYLKGLI